MALAAARIAAERVRLVRLGIIDANGDLVSRELPPDILPESDTSVDTGLNVVASRRERCPLLVGEGGEAMAHEHGVEIGDADGARCRDLDPDRCAVRIEVDVNAVPSSSVFATRAPLARGRYK